MKNTDAFLMVWVSRAGTTSFARVGDQEFFSFDGRACSSLLIDVRPSSSSTTVERVIEDLGDTGFYKALKSKSRLSLVVVYPAFEYPRSSNLAIADGKSKELVQLMWAWKLMGSVAAHTHLTNYQLQIVRVPFTRREHQAPTAIEEAQVISFKLLHFGAMGDLANAISKFFESSCTEIIELQRGGKLDSAEIAYMDNAVSAAFRDRDLDEIPDALPEALQDPTRAKPSDAKQVIAWLSKKADEFYARGCKNPADEAKPPSGSYVVMDAQGAAVGVYATQGEALLALSDLDDTCGIVDADGEWITAPKGLSRGQR